MLHARRIEMIHPATGQPLVVESRLPEDFEVTARDQLALVVFLAANIDRRILRLVHVLDGHRAHGCAGMRDVEPVVFDLQLERFLLEFLLAAFVLRGLRGLRLRHELGLGLVHVLTAYVLRLALTRHLPGFFPFYIFFFGWRGSKKKGQLKNAEKLAQLLPLYIKQAGRSELGALLELAGLVWKSPPLNSLLRDRLATLLPWTPTDELLLLTQMQRSSLRLVTANAIQEFRDNAFYEPLATAGLLALGTLGDQGVLKQAQGITLQQTQGRVGAARVGAAAEEYLTQIAK